ncbi:MAG TPA: response regulator transcription factor [Terriglobales bacterium]|jgi:DNA-binding response OmpR family regulator|nr:response regulator transcription factor [Terriglobales bacterium]
MSRVLIVEDEEHLAVGLKFNLEAEGIEAQVVGDGESGLATLLRSPSGIDAVILDVMLPGISGFEVVAQLRNAKQYVPVLMLTARGRPEDVLRGFAAGVDDYLAKPFELPILVARLRGLLRRKQWASGSQIDASREPASNEQPDSFAFDGKTIDFTSLELRLKKETIQLTVMEAELLRHLVRNEGKVVSRKSILEDVWSLREDTDTRAIDNFVVRLRRYIEDVPSKPKHLLTVRGVGYKFVAATK